MLTTCKKPLNVQEATMVDLRGEDKDFIAYSLVKHAKAYFKYELPAYSGGPIAFELPHRQVKFDHENTTAIRPPNVRALRITEAESNSMVNKHFYGEATFSLPNSLILEPASYSHGPNTRSLLSLPLTPREEVAWNMANNAARKIQIASTTEPEGLYAIGLRSPNLFQQTGTFYRGISDFSELISDLSDLVDEVMDDFKGSYWLLGIATLVHTAYGSIHMTAWNLKFPTNSEKWWWRGSCIAIAGAIPLYTMLWMMSGFLGFTGNPNEHWTKRIKLKPVKFLVDAVMVLLIFVYIWCANALLAAYVIARPFLIVESLISLREVPVGVYAAVPWSNFLPHF